MCYVELTNHIELLIHLVICIEKTYIFSFISQVYTDFSLYLKYIPTWARAEFCLMY